MEVEGQGGEGLAHGAGPPARELSSRSLNVGYVKPTSQCGKLQKEPSSLWRMVERSRLSPPDSNLDMGQLNGQ